MAKKQTRRSISVRGLTYNQLRDYCAGASISISDFIEQRIADFFVEHSVAAGRPVAVAVAPAPVRAPAPSPQAVAPIAERKSALARSVSKVSVPSAPPPAAQPAPHAPKSGGHSPSTSGRAPSVVDVPVRTGGTEFLR